MQGYPKNPGKGRTSIQKLIEDCFPSAPLPEAATGNCRLALELLAQGRSVVPMKPRSKRPNLRSWAALQQRRVDTAEIRRWYNRSPEPGVGVVTGSVSGVWILDVDSKPDVDGFEVLARLVRENGPLPETPLIRTGGGGVQYWFRLPEDTRIPSRSLCVVDPELRGLDVKGEGGICTVANVHPSGRTYYAVRSPLDTEIPLAPDWLLDLVTRPSVGQKLGDGQRRKSNGDAASEEQVAEFTELWQRVGVDVSELRGPTNCPFHPDRTPSLTIDLRTCRWKCFGCDRKGGLRKLRELVNGSPDPSGKGGCPNFPRGTKNLSASHLTSESDKPSLSSKSSLGKLGHYPCAVPIVTSRTRRWRYAPVPCERVTCDFCGPEIRQAELQHWCDVIEGLTLHRVVIEKAAWGSLRKRIARLDADYIRVPVISRGEERERLVILNTACIGERLDDPADAIVEAFNWLVVGGGSKPSSSRRWSYEQTTRPSDPDTEVFHLQVRHERFLAITEGYGYLGRRYSDGSYELKLPEVGDLRRRRWERDVGLCKMADLVAKRHRRKPPLPERDVDPVTGEVVERWEEAVAA